MTDDAPAGDDLVIDQDFIDKVNWDRGGGRELRLFNNLSVEIREKLRDDHVIYIIDNHFTADAITGIYLNGCVGITDTTLSHISNNCTNLETLGVCGCDKITDNGIKAIVENKVLGKTLKGLDYNACNGCSDAALQAVVQNCPNLEWLYAQNTGITHIPKSIGQDLPRLKQLDLSNNNIERLPPSIITLLSNKLEDFNISSNPLQHPPIETITDSLYAGYISQQGIEAISEYFTSRPVVQVDSKTALPISYQRDFPLVSVHLNNSGDVSLDYNSPGHISNGKIQLKLQSIQHVDEKGTLLSTDVFGEDTKYDLTGKYSIADKDEEAHDLLFTEDNITPRGGVQFSTATYPAAPSTDYQYRSRAKGGGKEETSAEKKNPSNERGIRKRMGGLTLATTTNAARGQQMPTLVTKYSSGDQKGQIELESFIVTKSGHAGMVDDDVSTNVSNGDFKFNLKLKREDGKKKSIRNKGQDDAAEPHFVDVQVKIQTDTAIIPMGNHVYKVVGTGTFLYVPNTFYALDEDSNSMKVQTMEETYPKLSDLDDSGNQYFTFRFTNASEIFYDPYILQKLWDVFSSFFMSPPEPPHFQEVFTLEETFTEREWEMVGKSIGDWVSDVLRAVSGDVTSIIDSVTTLLNVGYKNASSSKRLQLVKWQNLTPDDKHFPFLVAIKTEENETVKKAGFKKLITRKSSAKSARAQVFFIQAGNDVAYKELKGLRSNFESIANYHSFNSFVNSGNLDDRIQQMMQINIMKRLEKDLRVRG